MTAKEVCVYRLCIPVCALVCDISMGVVSVSVHACVEDIPRA